MAERSMPWRAAARSEGPGRDFQLRERGGRMGRAIPDWCPIEHPVAGQEHGAVRAPRHGMPSHFVGAAMSVGCVTSRCQMTA